MSDWLNWQNGLIITLLAIVILTPEIDVGFSGRLLLLGGLLILAWLKMYIERKQLLHQIRDAVSNAEREANLSQAKNESSSQLLDDTSEYQSHHAQK
jgi:hypothetical protein